MYKRILIYLNEMFPLSAFIGSMITAVAVQLTYLRLFDVRPDYILPLLIPALVLTAISLLIRIMDEFKDYQDDLSHFPSRPLPSGRVNKKDLKALGFFCVMVIIFLSLSSVQLLLWALVTLGFTGLMLKWFFIEKLMRKSLPLAFITHHPIIIFNFIYLLIATTQMSPLVTFEKAAFILPICLIFTNWEIVRKIRMPEQETAYTTYSKILGPRPAVSIAILLQLIFNLTAMLIFNKLGTPYILEILFAILQFGLMLPYFYFLVTLKAPKPLKFYSEIQILTVVGTLLVAALL